MSPNRGPSCHRSRNRRPPRNRTIQTAPPKRCRRGPPKHSFLSASRALALALLKPCVVIACERIWRWRLWKTRRRKVQVDRTRKSSMMDRVVVPSTKRTRKGQVCSRAPVRAGAVQARKRPVHEEELCHQVQGGCRGGCATQDSGGSPSRSQVPTYVMLHPPSPTQAPCPGGAPGLSF